MVECWSEQMVSASISSATLLSKYFFMSICHVLKFSCIYFHAYSLCHDHEVEICYTAHVQVCIFLITTRNYIYRAFKVTDILVENGRAVGVRVSKGEEPIEIRAKTVISAGGISSTLKLLPTEVAKKTCK